ncbi:MAG TPA: hypothetical protein VFB96_16005 [Pirellulaceae bacterium]|nr:hypothetical protein [Pirellulaceae bacterium]
MVRWIQVLVGSVLLLLFVGLLFTLVWFANEWITSTLATATVLVWLALWLVVVYRRERVRAMAVGALVAGGVYWMLALGPWFNVNIGPTLLTTRLLAWISAPPPQAGQPPAVYTTYPVNYTTGLPVQSSDLLLTGSGIVTTSSQPVWGYPTPQTVPLIVNVSPRQFAGQWAFTWLFALAGGGLAWLLAWSAAPAASKENKPASAPAEGKP